MRESGLPGNDVEVTAETLDRPQAARSRSFRNFALCLAQQEVTTGARTGRNGISTGDS